MQCNIDARGKRVRFVSGLSVLFIGLVLLVFALVGTFGWWMWAVALVALACGAFQIFEARAGWCAVRAMGIKTPVERSAGLRTRASSLAKSSQSSLFDPQRLTLNGFANRACERVRFHPHLRVDLRFLHRVPPHGLVALQVEHDLCFHAAADEADVDLWRRRAVRAGLRQL